MEPHRRKGFPLSVKLTLTTAVLVAAAVAAAGIASLRTLDALAEQNAAARRAAGQAAIQRQSELMARADANAAALALVEGNFTYLDTLVAETVREDPHILWMLIADATTKRVVARSQAAPQADRLEDDLDAAVAGAPSNRAMFARDPADPARFKVGIRVQLGDRVLGQLRLGVSTQDLEAELQRSLAEARRDAERAAAQMALFAALIVAAGVLVSAWQATRVARPIKALSAQAHRIAEGDLEQRVDVRTHDEVGRLGEDFNFMAQRLRELIADTADKASLQREMSLAREIQESMVPGRELIEHGPFRVIGYCEPATTCGGDWWTIRRLGDDRVFIAVGDVTGHGMSSAMIAATARGAVEALAKVDERLLVPEGVLRAIDGAIRGLGAQMLLMTCFCALIDARRGVVEFSNAGHNFPYLLHRDGDAVTDIAVLALRGSPLGAPTDDMVISTGQRALLPGDVFVFFTDGLIDRADPTGNRFGDRRLQRFLRGRSGADVPDLMRDMLGIVDEFSRGTPADDDVTLVFCEYRPRPAETMPKEAVG
jgi:sigma-B regulation protein RsbU (phosphoserine phosphatase)